MGVLLGSSGKRVMYFFSRGSVFYVYATGTSASAEGFVAYAATGDLAGETYTLKLPLIIFLVLRNSL